MNTSTGDYDHLHLNWSAPIEKMAAKARKVWGVIKRMTQGARITAGLQLHISLVVPILEYRLQCGIPSPLRTQRE